MPLSADLSTFYILFFSAGITYSLWHSKLLKDGIRYAAAVLTSKVLMLPLYYPLYTGSFSPTPYEGEVMSVHKEVLIPFTPGHSLQLVFMIMIRQVSTES